MDVGHILQLVKQLNGILEQCRSEHQDLTPSQSLMMGYLFTQAQSVFYPSDLQLQLGISRPSVSRMLKILRNQGYLELSGCSEDERKKRIVLTDRAYASQKQIEAGLILQRNWLCEGISAEELQVMDKCLQIMIGNVKQRRAEISPKGT